MKLFRSKPLEEMQVVVFWALLLMSAFPVYPILTARSVLSINDNWKFYKGNSSGATDVSFNDNASGWSTVHLPHTFEYLTYNPGNSFYHGVGTYRKHLIIAPEYAGKKIYLTLEGASSTARVYVNGTQVSTHYYGWTPIVIDLTELVTIGTADNVITVFVDNTAQTDIPGTGGPLDFIINGGLYRDAYLTITDKVHLPDPVFAKDAGGGTFVTYSNVSTASAGVSLKTWIKNDGNASGDFTVRWSILDASNVSVGTAQKTQTVNTGVTVPYQGSITVVNPSLWEPAQPYRYTMRTEVLSGGTTLLDDHEEHIGIRTLRWDVNDGFFINGKPLKLFGVNRHEMWPFVGHAAPNNLQLFDAIFLKNMGCNMLRLSHYPQDPSFLDACDSLGLLVYEEAPGGSNNGQTPPFSNVWDTRARESMREMVRRDRNRPSVICWGTLNEPQQNAAWDAEANALLHELDPTRPTTMSRNYFTNNNVYDVYSMNIFENLPDENPDTRTNGFLNSEHTGHTFPTKRDTSEQRLLEHAGKHEFMNEQAMSRKWVAGSLGWCAFDYNSANSWNTGSNIMFHGVCDLMRIPKFVYWFYQSQKDAAEPMVHIANFWQKNSPLSIRVYSNCELVRLSTWNGSDWRPVSTQNSKPGSTLLHPPFIFTLPDHYSDRLRAEGLIGGVVQATHIVREPGTPQKLVMEIEPDSIIANGGDMCRLLISIVDVNGTVCPYATGTIDVSLSGPGILIGDNPLTVLHQAASHQCGCFGFLIRSKYGDPGTITATAASGGLTGASATVISLPKDYRVGVARKSMGAVFASSGIEMRSYSTGTSSLMHFCCRAPEGEKLLLQLFDVKGRLVKTLFNEKTGRSPVTVVWDSGLSVRGMYVLTAKSGLQALVSRIVVR
ncbi:MAG: hypothetical protein JW863_04260 [Chitinispirillaceae bacterium]|nr:hypothetical protein [Chitinispirillaceae bacterium]